MLDSLKSRFSLSKGGEDYEALPSEPKEREAESRTPKQSRRGRKPKPVESPEVEAVLSYIGQYEDTLITLDEISRGSGIAKNRVSRVIRQLVDEGAVVCSQVVPRHGRRYMIQRGPTPSGDVVTMPSVPDGSEGEDIDFVKITNSLVFEFIRATRSTDVLLYLTWLEGLEKSDA